MASNTSNAAAVLPPAIIAQAEAAIAGNAAESPRPRRRTSATAETRPTDSDSRAFLTIPDISEPLPSYGSHLDRLQITHDGFDTKADLTDDGRVNININQKTRHLSDLLVPALRSQLSLVADEEKNPLPPGYIPPALGGRPGQVPPPPLNVVIHVVGSRGDVQPFVALGKTLKSTYGHRVRLATHPTFQTFVEENGLEFFSIGGDPAELMAFMVKNPGLMPGFDSLKSGDVGKRRKGMEEIVLGCWRSCIEPGDGLGAPRRTDQESDHVSFDAGINMDTSPTERPFIADAIIANPPSFAHIHIAEKLGIPLHLMFTMPWSPTQQFPHPLANIQSSNADVNMTNFVSYVLVEMMTWQGLGDVINRFREKALDLDPISLIWAPALIPKPKDWAQHISISGFYFLSLASSFQPHPDLQAFLDAGPPPVYIGFGSIVVEDPNAMTKLIFEAVRKAGIRALVSKGWGGLGADELGIPDGVYMLGNVPHDWLFKHVSCVVHHGGAGTTAAGIKEGCPTVVVPFFGDQPFWGNMTFRAGAGPAPIPYKQLTAEKLASAIREALKPGSLQSAQMLGAKIREEEGTEVGGKAFHDHLKVDDLRCSLAPSRVAVWRVKRTKIRLSALAATVLANEGLLEFSNLKLYRAREYETEDGPWDPISGGASALIGTMASMSMGIADVPVEIFRAFKKQASKETSSAAPADQESASSAHADAGMAESRIAKEGAIPSDQSSRSQSSRANSSTSFDVSSKTTQDTSLLDKSTGSMPGERIHRGDSLKNALNNATSRSRSSSRNRGSSPGRSCSPSARAENFDPSKLTLEHVTGAGKGVSRIVGAGMKSPMDFTLALARGFHNAPKLYGDDTVRPQEKVTDFQSGLKAAGKEFGYGFYDGITGLVTQPLRGAEKEGAAGLMKGIARGIGGLVLKPGAAIWGLPGYTFMGIHKEIRRLFGTSVSNYIISARTAQGYEHWKASSEEERGDIVRRWHEAIRNVPAAKKATADVRTTGEPSGRTSPKGFMQTRHLSFDERKKLHEDRKARRAASSGTKPSGLSSTSDLKNSRSPAISRTLESGHSGSSYIDAESAEEFEHAIKASVASTSRGDPEEDLMIERAIRASVRELQQSGSSAMSEQEAFDRAIRASLTESTDAAAGVPHVGDGADATQETNIAIHDVETVKKADARPQDSHAFRADHKDSALRTEEDIVMEYVKRQSLLEQEHKRAVGTSHVASSTSDGTAADIDDDEADLRVAIAESLKTSNVNR